MEISCKRSEFSFNSTVVICLIAFLQRLPTSYQQPHQLGCKKDKGTVIQEDEDDGLTCRLCMASYWYKREMHEHLKTVHSITDPEKYDREEKVKPLPPYWEMLVSQNRFPGEEDAEAARGAAAVRPGQEAEGGEEHRELEPGQQVLLGVGDERQEAGHHQADLPGGQAEPEPWGPAQLPVQGRGIHL
jgi:hypothetical protein